MANERQLGKLGRNGKPGARGMVAYASLKLRRQGRNNYVDKWA